MLIDTSSSYFLIPRRNAMTLHVRVIRSPASLGDNPVDVLGRVLDVAGLAVHAVLGVDLQTRVAPVLVADDLVDARRAVALLGGVVKGEIHAYRNRRIAKREMAGLVLLVVRARQVHRRELVEAHHTVGLRIVDARVLGCLPELRVVGVDPESPGRLPLEYVLVDARVDHARPQPLVEGRADVARAV